MKKILFLFTAIASLSSCISLVNYQTGKTLGEGNSEILLSMEVLPLDKNDLSKVAFAPGASFYHGVSDRIDLGIRYEGGLAGSVGAKFQILGNQHSKFALALDPRFGGIFIPENKLSPFTVIPGIVSFHPTEKLAFMVAEEFYYLPADENHTSFSHSLGLEYGGDNAKFVLGTTSNYYGLGIFQFGAGIKLRF